MSTQNSEVDLLARLLDEHSVKKQASKSDQIMQITFEYYKHQRDEYMHIAQERSSITIQLLIILGALVAATFQANSIIIREGIALSIMFLGIIGLLIFRNLNKDAIALVRRARSARKALGFLEEFSASGQDFGIAYRYYSWIYIFIVIVGILFSFTPFI